MPTFVTFIGKNQDILPSAMRRSLPVAIAAIPAAEWERADWITIVQVNDDGTCVVAWRKEENNGDPEDDT